MLMLYISGAFAQLSFSVMFIGWIIWIGGLSLIITLSINREYVPTLKRWAYTLLHAHRVKTDELTPQSRKLFNAFLSSKNHFLSHDTIAEICGWNVEDIGIEARRKSAISYLRQSLKAQNIPFTIDASVDGNHTHGYHLTLIK
jgi:hypothetical protein